MTLLLSIKYVTQNLNKVQRLEQKVRELEKELFTDRQSVVKSQQLTAENAFGNRVRCVTFYSSSSS